MNRPVIRNVRWTVMALMVMFGGCDDSLQTQTPTEPVLSPGVHAVIVVALAAAGQPAEVQLHLRRAGVETAIASYQGELLYDVSRLTVQGASFPSGVAGAWNEVEPGHIRFAAAGMDGLGGSLALTLRAVPRGEIAASSFRVIMTELIGAASYENLTSRFVRREHPHFSTAPLQD